MCSFSVCTVADSNATGTSNLMKWNGRPQVGHAGKVPTPRAGQLGSDIARRLGPPQRLVGPGATWSFCGDLEMFVYCFCSARFRVCLVSETKKFTTL
jgi:hypothetical protein